MAVEVVEDVAGAAADRIAAQVRAGGRRIALSGGSTPVAAHRLVAAIEGLDWSSTELWFSDDRAVGPEDERSNYRMARESLLDLLDGPEPEVRRVRGELGHEAAAQEYERELRNCFGDGPPALDLLLLGVGPDVHTASLFPGKPAVDERERWVVGVPEAGMEPYVPRVTFTLPAIAAAREVVFLISGAGKADAAEKAFGAGPSHEYPASLVTVDGGEPTVLIDPPAAARLVR